MTLRPRYAALTVVLAVAVIPLVTAQGAHAVAPTTCDFDGDGTNDLAVGVPGENEKGYVNIQYKKTGTLSGPAGISGPGLAVGSQYGSALACGDFNSDGIDDLAVGAPASPEGGRVYVHYGKTDVGLKSSSNYQSFHQDLASIPGDADPGDRFGHALASGDFNGDGRDDLAIGVPFDANHLVDRTQPVGSLVVVKGSTPNVGLDFTGVQQKFGWAILEDYEVNDQRFGWSLDSGPFVPGYPESLVVGAPQTNVVPAYWGAEPDQDCAQCEEPWGPSEYRAGRVYVLRGGVSMISYQHVDGEYAAGWGGEAAEPGDEFGYSVAGGDFDGDGDLDLAVGVPGDEIGAIYAGSVAVVEGPIAGPVGYADVTAVVQSDIGGANESDDRFGWAVDAGDYDVDGRDDLVVGVPFENIGKILDAGAVFVFRGQPGELVGNDGVILYQGNGAPDTSEPQDWFGATLATVPLIFGPDDLVIGIPGEEGQGFAPGVMIAGAISIGVGFPDQGPAADETFFLHQDVGNPFNVAGVREVSYADAPVDMSYEFQSLTGEMFGWAIAS